MPFNHLAKPSQSADIVALFILVLVYSRKKFNGDFIVTVFCGMYDLRWFHTVCAKFVNITDFDES